MGALRRSTRISRKERIRNVTIRQQFGLEEPIIKKNLSKYMRKVKGKAQKNYTNRPTISHFLDTLQEIQFTATRNDP